MAAPGQQSPRAVVLGVAGGGKGHQNSASAAETLPVCLRARLGGTLRTRSPQSPRSPGPTAPPARGQMLAVPRRHAPPRTGRSDAALSPSTWPVRGARPPGSPRSFPGGGPAHGPAPAGLQAARPSCCCFLPAPSQTQALRTVPGISQARSTVRRLPGDHRRPDLPSVHATGLSAEGKGHHETRRLPVPLPGTPTASCPSGCSLLVSVLAPCPGCPVMEQRAARDSASLPAPGRLPALLLRATRGVWLTRALAARWPADWAAPVSLPGADTGSPLPLQPSDLTAPEGPGTHAVRQGWCQPPPCRRSLEAEGTCRPGACGRAGPGPFPRPAPWPRACSSTTHCPAGAWIPRAAGPSATPATPSRSLVG